MQDLYTSTVYHIDQFGQLPSGALLRAKDRPGGIVDVYLHPLHVRSELVWDLNWLTRHQVGNGLWRPGWAETGHMNEPAEGLGIAASRWEIVPAAAMPRRRTVIPVEEEGSVVWLVREGSCTRAMRDAMNALLDRIAGDGLWLQCWYERRERPAPEGSGSPLLAPPALPLSV
ncbi:hypothetical protein [Streptomyces justiciae]|uniref:Uncharacterized protein n=1 Tax=Streptomyces justiciae TaxID=2780140 RepID=A0ABU3M878_9ACTN|nr:hypothetical protein [Streptomyces justiciae]MDT7847256.1 hypothetical protein [Streptomyces justiciae]